MLMSKKKLEKIKEEVSKDFKRQRNLENKKKTQTINRIKKEHEDEVRNIKNSVKTEVQKTVSSILAEEREFYKSNTLTSRNDPEFKYSEEGYSYLYETEENSMAKILDMSDAEIREIYKGRKKELDRAYRYIKEIKEGNDQGWRQLGLGVIKDLDRYQSLEQLWDKQDAAFNKTRTNPHARSIVNNIQYFTIGRGIKFSAANEEVQKLLIDFWDLNKMDLRQKDFVRKSYIEGEYFILYFINKKTGRVKVRRIRPKEVHSIETHPDDVETIFAYKRVWSEDYGVKEQHYADIDYYHQLDDEIDGKASKVHGNLEEDKLVQFIKYGDSDEVRGRVPMDSILKNIKYYEDWLLDRIRLNHERSKVVWIKSIRGRGKETGTVRTRVPKGGQQIIETDRVRYRIESAKIQADDVKEDGLSILYSIGAGVGIPVYLLDQRLDEQNYSCHSSDTELLTDSGWKNYYNINKSDKAGTINPDTNLFEWQGIDEKFVYDYDGDMYRLKSRSAEGLFTPNHDMLISDSTKKTTKKDNTIETKWKKTRMDQLAESFYSSRPYIMNSVEWTDDCDDYKKFNGIKIGDKFYDGNLFLDFLGIYIGDGCVCFHTKRYKDSVYDMHYISFHVKKSRKIDYFSPILESMGFLKYTKIDGDIIWTLKNIDLANWLKENIGLYCYNKKLPEFIKILPKDQLSLFYKSLLESDGHYVRGNIDGNTGRRYTTTSESLAEDVFLIAIRLGYKSYIGSQFNKDSSRRRCYFVQMSIPNNYRREILTKKHNITKEHYKGKVWCVSVPNGIIVTRFNNKICISGNSIRKGETGFSQMITDNQDFWNANFKKMFQVVIRAAVSAGKIKKMVKVPKFRKETIIEAMSKINTMYMDGATNAEIVEEVSPILEGKHESITINTEDTPVSVVFPDVVKEDFLDQAKVLQIHKEIGIASHQTLAERSGYNWYEELLKIKNEIKTVPKVEEPKNPSAGKKDGDGDGKIGE